VVEAVVAVPQVHLAHHQESEEQVVITEVVAVVDRHLAAHVVVAVVEHWPMAIVFQLFQELHIL
jgi:hypothetical protein